MITLNNLKQRSLRNMGKVQRIVEKKVISLIEQAYEEGIFVQISSGHRTLKEQAVLYGKGRLSYQWNGKHYGSQGKIVTYARPGQSNHHDGRAVDFFLVSADGKKALWTVNEKWRRVAEIGKAMGFSWGGDWTKFKDYAHLELLSDSTPSSLKKSGDHGTGVTKIQTMLRNLGYSLGPAGIDGHFGVDTESAVKRFQSKEGLEVDGVAGPLTMEKLRDRTYPGKSLRQGAKGKSVKQVQKVVGVEADGSFGKRTDEFVRAYQRQHCLQVDGIVGPKTWRSMFGF